MSNLMEHALEGAGVRTDGIRGRAERDRRLAPVLAELEKLARRAPPVPRKRKPTTTTVKETRPMPIDYHKPGHVIDDPRSEPPPPPPNGNAMPGFPLALQSEIMAFEGIFRVPNPEPVRKQRAIDLARRVLDYPERDRGPLVAALLYRLAMSRAR